MPGRYVSIHRASLQEAYDAQAPDLIFADKRCDVPLAKSNMIISITPVIDDLLNLLLHTSTMADLTLRIKRYWFDEILLGKKKVEFRELNDYYRSRIEGKDIDKVVLIPGYSKDVPVLVVHCKKIVVNRKTKEYQIHVTSKDSLWFDDLAQFKDYKAAVESERQVEGNKKQTVNRKPKR
jgi:hypothetical protein